DGPAACWTGFARFLLVTSPGLSRAETISDALRRRIVRFLVAGRVLLVAPPSAAPHVPDAGGDARCADEEGEAANGRSPFGSRETSWVRPASSPYFYHVPPHPDDRNRDDDHESRAAFRLGDLSLRPRDTSRHASSELRRTFEIVLLNVVELEARVS